MSFFQKLSSFFGLGDSAEDQDIDLTSDDPEEGADEQPCVSTKVAAPQTAVGIDPEMKGRIFEEVLTVFNATLPDFLQRSIDPAAQRRAMAESIDRSLDRYLDAVGAEAERRAEARLHASITESKEEAAQMRTRIQQLEKQNEKTTDNRLSAERRYRALSDRVSDLEQQLADAEAEREQLDLEKRSLMNKLKVSEIQGNAAPEEVVAEVERLRQRVADFENSSEVNKGIFDDLQSQLKEASARADSESLRADSERERADNEHARAEAFAKELDDEKTKSDALRKQLDENTGLASELAELQATVGKVEEIIAKKDEKISRLKAANKKLRDDLVNANGEITMLRNAEGTSLFAAADNNPEDDFECPEWFASEPDPCASIPRPQMPEFGYQEPPRKPKAPENDAQLSLFE